MDRGFGATAIGIEGMNTGEAFTIGNYIYGNSNIRANAFDSDFQHEYGHYIQSQILGPAYFARVALPSLYFSITDKNNNNVSRSVELDASIRGFMYFNKHVEGFYSTREEWNNKGGDYHGWDFRSNPLTKYGDGEYHIGIYVDYYNLKMLWDSGSIPSYVHWYNSLMPRLQLFYSGIKSKNDDYEVF